MKTQSEMLPPLPKHLKKNLVVKTKLPHDVAEAAKNLLAMDLPNNKKVISVYSYPIMDLPYRVDDIIEKWCRIVGLTKKQLLSKESRRKTAIDKKDIVSITKRQYLECFLYENRHHFRIGIKRISIATRSNHSTVLWSKKTVNNLCVTDKSVREEYNEYTTKLRREIGLNAT